MSVGATCNHILTNPRNEAWKGKVQSKDMGCLSKRKMLPWSWQELNYSSYLVPITRVSPAGEMAFLGSDLRTIFLIHPNKDTLFVQRSINCFSLIRKIFHSSGLQRNFISMGLKTKSRWEALVQMWGFHNASYRSNETGIVERKCLFFRQIDNKQEKKTDKNETFLI